MKKTFGIIIVMICMLSVSVVADTSRIFVSMVNQDPDPAISGDIVEIRLGIENRGENAVDDLMMEIVPEYPYEEVSGEPLVKKVPTIGAFQVDDDNQIVRFKLRVNRDATAGDYELKVNYWSDGSESTKKQTSLTLDVESQKNAEVIYIDKFQIVPGEVTPMTFTINNVGSAPLRELTFHWENEDGVVLPVGSDDTRYIKYIDIGEKAELVYNVVASSNADPDLYKLALKLTYDDPLSDEPQVIETAAGVYVGGETDFDIAFSGSNQGETSFSVSNIGSVPASSVTVKVPRQPGWQISGSNAVIIGNLDKGDYTVASFSLQQRGADSDSPNEEQRERMRQMREEGGDAPEGRFQRGGSSNSNVVVEIDYTDTRGQRHTVSKEVFVDPSSMRSGASSDGQGSQQFAGRPGGRQQQQQESSNTKWIVVGIVVLIVLFFANKTYKKRRLDNPDYTYGMLVKDTFSRKKIKK